MNKTLPAVLLVEDDPVTRHLLRLILTSAGFSVREAKDGLQAIGLFQAHSVDAVIMDLSMPLIDGLSAIRTLRLTEIGARLPIIVVTGSSDPEMTTNAMEAGASEVLIKPVAPEHLMQCVHEHLSLDPK